ncbi:MAG: hypothetical protein AAFQ14_03230 [Cyanobacteria bacterium J06621_12]
MDKYYILNLDPQAAYEWDRCVLRNPMTGARPDLNAEVASMVSGQTGSYLIKISLQVEILEQDLTLSGKTIELPAGNRTQVVGEARLENRHFPYCF